MNVGIGHASLLFDQKNLHAFFAAIVVIEQRKIYIPRGSQTLDVTVAVPKRYFAEYLVNPAALRSASGAPVRRD